MMAMMRRRRSGEDGALLVEAAFILPILLVLVFGLVEFGFGWRDRLMTETAVRSGARTASNLGPDRYADYNALQSVKSGLADIAPGNVDRIVIFKANTSGTVPATCAAGTAQTGVCNVYTGADLSLAQTAFTGTTSCTGTSPDRFWCPVSRANLQGPGPDYLGIWVRAHRVRFTALLPGTTTIESSAVMRLEPAESH
jgi:Flp pilus assembly protein TadG